MTDETHQYLLRIRVLVGIVIAGLVLSGITAFPLLREVALLQQWLSEHNAPPAITAWISQVHTGLSAVDRDYPFLAYGTDWLAFGHLIIALLFIGAFIDPVRNSWLISAGQVACLLVIPLAFICGEMRGIPLWWRAIDSAFGFFGFIPLWVAGRLTRRLERLIEVAARPEK